MLNCVIIILMFLGIVLFQLKVGREDIINPSIVFLTYWVILIVLGIIMYSSTYQFNYLGLYWILLMSFLFYFFYFFISKYLKNNSKSYIKTSEDIIYYSTNFLKFVPILIVIFLSLRSLGMIYYLFINNISLKQLFNPNTFMQTIETFTLMKYKVIDSNYSSIISITNTLSLVGVELLGFYFIKLDKTRKKQLLIYAFITFLFSSIITASKSDIIFTILLFCSTFLTSIYVLKFDVYNFFMKNKRKLFAIFFIFIFFIILLMIAFIGIRSGFEKSVIDGIKQYALGMVPAFDYYFSFMRPSELSWGVFSILGILTFFGYNNLNLPMGIYDEINIGFGNYSTNIFTAFRSIIDDFGLIGCIVFFVLFGIICALIYNNLQKHKYLNFSIACMSFMLGFILFSFIISIGNYFSICLSYVILYFILLSISSSKKYNLQKVKYLFQKMKG